MKTIGMLGGMSWESTVTYYEELNRGVAKALGGFHNAKSVLITVDFEEIEACQAENRWDDAGNILADAARKAEAAGADYLFLCTNTMHKVSDAITAAISIPFVQIGDVTAEALKAAGHKKVGLLGTRFTMEEDFYVSRLEAAGLEVVIPGAEDRAEVNLIIFEELVLGTIKPESKARYLEIADRLIADGAEAVILGCTEIGLLIQDGDCAAPLFDTTLIHVQKAVELALSE